jgi:hypothetical protein
LKIIITDRAVRWSFTTLRPAVLLWYIVLRRVQSSFTNPHRAVLRLFISPHPVPENRGIAAEKNQLRNKLKTLFRSFFYPDM